MQKDFPTKSNQAIADYECMEIAREIIAREDAYQSANKNDSGKVENLIQHYENMKEYFIEKFGENSCFARELQSEIDVQKNGYRKDNQGNTNHDDILRIRAVFDLYE